MSRTNQNALPYFRVETKKSPASTYHRVVYHQIDTLPQFQTADAALGMESGQRSAEMNEQNKSEDRAVFSREYEKGSSQNMPLSSSSPN